MYSFIYKGLLLHIDRNNQFIARNYTIVGGWLEEPKIYQAGGRLGLPGRNRAIPQWNSIFPGVDPRALPLIRRGPPS